MDNTKPLLSIGLIFKNEIRCLERCLRSFNALKRAVPCEIIAADTGSTDGSRAVAERYADILFDFPWIDDFAAARNAVMDRASGTWFLTVDADEWLDKDISNLVGFLKNPKCWGKFIVCGVTIRNYTRYDLTGNYSDFSAVRILRMSSGLRYAGAIHERWEGNLGVVNQLDVIFHHDGYVDFTGARGMAKRERNMALLREEYRKNPDDLLLGLQCVESSQGEEMEGYLLKTLEGVREKRMHWDHVGPPAFRHAVFTGSAVGRPGWRDLAAEAEELFPNSYYIRIDIASLMVFDAANENRYEDAVRYGERYLDALKKYRIDHSSDVDLSYSSLQNISEEAQWGVQVRLADAYFETASYRKGKALLAGIDYEKMGQADLLQCVATMMNIHSKGQEDLRLVLSNLWTQVDRREDAAACKQAIVDAVRSLFSTELQRQNRQIDYRLACEMFNILEGKCVLGDAAVLLTETKPKRLNAILARQEDLSQLPASALLHALSNGAAFPLPGRPMKLEEMDAFAAQLMGQEPEDFLTLAVSLEPGTDAQTLCWAKTVAMAGVKGCGWKNEERSAKLARVFAEVERKFLPLCYAPEMLTAENCFLLPPMHRFGWYISRAFRTLEQGDATGYARLLRSALDACPGMREMVEFLTEHTPELRPSPSQELLELAEKVRGLLSALGPDDPAVAAVKQSPVYQKVAYLIEGTEAPVMGGPAQ